jgi:hypothetical protein
MFVHNKTLCFKTSFQRYVSLLCQPLTRQGSLVLQPATSPWRISVGLFILFVVTSSCGLFSTPTAHMQDQTNLESATWAQPFQPTCRSTTRPIVSSRVPTAVATFAQNCADKKGMIKLLQFGHNDISFRQDLTFLFHELHMLHVDICTRYLQSHDTLLHRSTSSPNLFSI